MDNFYDPTLEHLEKLSGPWCCSFSGGKDSTSLVTWIEWLRRTGRIAVDRPQLVRSDTGVEEQNLVGVAEELATLLESHGWQCAVVRPEVHERLYPQILGRGLPPIHPGVRRMRWCTRSTKIDPMDRHNGEGRLSITGLRLGESAMRDGKIKRASCSAGGECGIPDPGAGRYSPILRWKTCQVVDWLNGTVGADVRGVMRDVFAVTKRLVEIYGFRYGQATFAWDEPEVESARFGCVGCPAIGAEAFAPKSVVRRNGEDSPLNELYDVWHEARLPVNRLAGVRKGKPVMGPVRLEARKRLLVRVLDIQRRAGVVLVTPEDEAFIQQCWADKVYPRGWSEADELVEPPTETPLFDAQEPPS